MYFNIIKIRKLVNYWKARPDKPRRNSPTTERKGYCHDSKVLTDEADGMMLLHRQERRS